VNIAPALLRAYPALNDAQRAIIGHSAGPLLVIAGPGSGKTFSLVLRALNLLLLSKATPRELVVCTFTEKAAFESAPSGHAMTTSSIVKGSALTPPIAMSEPRE
jgi:hypothetical protein